MNNIYAVFTIVFCAVFGLGFIILAVTMFLDKTPRNKIPKPAPWLDNDYYKNQE